MARQQDQAPRLLRSLQVGAVGLLAASAALAFSRVFVAGDVALRLVAVALGSVALAWALERRMLLVATLVSTAGLLVTLGIAVFPDTTFYGLPTLHTYHSILDALGKVGPQARVEAAPTLSLEPLLVGAVTAVWTAAFSAHALAVRSGSPFLAVLPPAALLAFASIVMEDGARPLYALVFLGSVLLVLFADALQRISQWGPIRPWSAYTRRPLARSTTRGARRLGVAVLAVAALAPGILPGFRAPPIVEIDSSAAGVSSVNPLVSVAASLQRDDPVELFTVSSTSLQGVSVATYWRMLALDRFDGTVWDTDDIRAENGRPLPGGGRLSDDPVPADAVVVEQRFVITGMRATPWLPMAYVPQALLMPGGELLYDDEATMVVASDGIGPGDAYAVQSAVPVPSPAVLDRTVGFGGRELEPYLRLPENTPEEVYRIARELTAGEPSVFRKVLAVQDHLLTFTYDETVTPGTEVNAMVDFLTRTRRGFCQQFAGSMAVLLRALGIPSRVAVGFVAGARSPADGLYHVTSDDAHSWVEVYFPGQGWLAFEPTPGRSNPLASRYQREPAPAGPSPAWCATQGCPPGVVESAEAVLGAVVGGVGRGGRAERISNLEELDARRSGAGSGGTTLPGAGATGAGPADRGLPMWGGVLLALGLVLAIAALVPMGRAAWRRRQIRRAREPREVVLAAYRVFQARAGEVGLGRRPGETLWEHRTRLLGIVELSDGHLDRLTGIAGRAAYSIRPVSETLAQEAVLAARTASRDVRRSVSRGRRLAGHYRLLRRTP
ncbi:MAG: transglutaminase domain-containing protein [Actinobacteria bacterium]|nr:transglutaminase domain-containing protein [Actinomycetota bacterium]